MAAGAERLFHVSETPGIRRFTPRPDRRGRAVVWAISESRLVGYLVPRDCPRVTFHALPETAAADRRRFLGDAATVVAVESAWAKRCRATTLHVYELDPATFVLEDEIAGYHVSPHVAVPVGVERVPDPAAAIAERGAELRVLPSLWELREAVASSSLGFSVIRMRNAAPPPAGFRTRFPVPC